MAESYVYFGGTAEIERAFLSVAEMKTLWT